MSGMIGNDGLNTNMGQLVLHAHNAAGLITAAGVSTGILDAGATHGPLIATNSGQSGVVMDTAERLVWRVSTESWGNGLGMCDPTHDILCEVLWECSKSGGATGVVWKAFAKLVDDGAAMGLPSTSSDGSCTFTAASPGDTVLATTGPKPLGLNNKLQLSSPTDKRRHKRFLNVMIELDDRGTAAATENILCSVVLYYTVGFLNDDARRKT